LDDQPVQLLHPINRNINRPIDLRTFNFNACFLTFLFFPQMLRNFSTKSTIDILRQFNKDFTRDSLKKELFQITFSRSSGPGGQNVNKVNSKVDLRFPLNPNTFIPSQVIQLLREKQSLRINKKNEFCISSDRYRTQHANLEDCLDKVFELIMESTVVANDTSEVTKLRVKDLKAGFAKKSMQMKQQRSNTKQHRRKD
jgi:protein subunit release factor B